MRTTQVIKIEGKLALRHPLVGFKFKVITGFISWCILLMAQERQKARKRGERVKRNERFFSRTRTSIRKNTPAVCIIYFIAGETRGWQF